MLGAHGISLCFRSQRAQAQQLAHTGFTAGHQFFHLFGKGVNAAGQNKVRLARHDEVEQVLFQMPLHLGTVLVKQLADSAGAFFRAKVAQFVQG